MGDNELFPWPLFKFDSPASNEKVSDWLVHSVNLYLTVMNRLATTFGTLLDPSVDGIPDLAAPSSFGVGGKFSSWEDGEEGSFGSKSEINMTGHSRLGSPSLPQWWNIGKLLFVSLSGRLGEICMLV